MIEPSQRLQTIFENSIKEEWELLNLGFGI